MKLENYKSAMISISQLVHNTGQIEDVPKNPRVIRNDDFERTKRNIQAHPDMLAYRGLIVYKVGKKYVVVCGNQRLAAMRDLGYSECPCVIIPQDTPKAKIRAYIIKDNLEYGKWDMDELANNWACLDDLQELGVDISEWQVKEQDFDGDGEINVDDFNETMTLHITLPRNKAEWLKDRMREYHPQAEKAILLAIDGFDGVEEENEPQDER